MKVIQLIKSLLALMTYEQRRRLYLLQALVIISALVELLSITAIGPFIALVSNTDLMSGNSVIQSLCEITGSSGPFEFLMFVGSVIVLLLVMSTVLNILSIRKLSMFAAEVGAEFSDALYSFYLNKDYLYHVATNSSVLIKQIATEVSRVTDNIFQPLVQINARLISVLLISGFLFFYNAVVSITGLLVIFICYYLLFYFVRDKLAQNGNILTEASKKRFRLMNESFAAVKEINILGCHKMFVDDFHETGNAFSKAYGSSNGLYNAPRYLVELIVFGGVISGVLLSFYFGSGKITNALPSLSVFAVAIFKLLPSFQQMYSGSAQIRGNYSAFIAIRDDLSEARMNKNEKTPIVSSDVSDNMNIGGDIVLSDVTFKYPGKEFNVLDGVSMKIAENSFVGIAGNSGSGKSTLFDLLLGVLTPDFGQITVGGVSISKSTVINWQRKIGYVSQHVFLKDGSLAENIAFGIPDQDIDLDKVKNVIADVQLTSWVNSLPSGVFSHVGESGSQISGGQKQRIGIARTLYHDAEVLFFDEATSALDGITEKKLMSSIMKMKRKKTIIMIAHRLNTLKQCDCIYFFDNGNLVDEGTYNSLVDRNRQFRMMALGANNG